MTGFIHYFEVGKNPDTVILALHGTGGNENDLVPLARDIAPDASILSLRGKVLENGMSRFFRRFPDGSFDQEDLAFRTSELADFIQDFKRASDLEDKRMIAVGYSNGANIASAMLLLRPEILSGAILFRGMTLFQPVLYPDLSDKSILILSGKNDPVIPLENARRLHAIFEETHAYLRMHELDAGHGLTQHDIGLARDWMKGL